jgi:hypothetical protein
VNGQRQPINKRIQVRKLEEDGYAHTFTASAPARGSAHLRGLDALSVAALSNASEALLHLLNSHSSLDRGLH